MYVLFMLMCVFMRVCMFRCMRMCADVTVYVTLLFMFMFMCLCTCMGVFSVYEYGSVYVPDLFKCVIMIFSVVV